MVLVRLTSLMCSCIALLGLGVTSANCEVMSLPFKETFDSAAIDAGWKIDASAGNAIGVSNASLQIDAHENSYAHIQRPLGVDYVTVSARIKPSKPAGISWCTSLFVLWDGGNWCQLGIRQTTAGGLFYVTEMKGGVPWELSLSPCSLDDWKYLRIQLGKDCIRYEASDDGAQWSIVKIVERSPAFAGAPASVHFGKGYGRAKAPYVGSELNNDYTDRGSMASSAIDNIAIDKTPKGLQLLSREERKAMVDADLDPVGTIELKGKADPTFASVSSHYGGMKYPKETVGVPEHPIDISVDHLGRLQLLYDQPLISWLEIGEASVPFGDEKTLITRRLHDGYIPVVHLTITRDNVKYEQTVFGWNSGFSPDKPLFAYIRLKARALSGGVVPSQVFLVSASEKTRSEWPMKATGPGEAEVCLRYEYPKPGSAEAVSSDDFEKTLTRTAAFWSRLIAPFTPFEIPETRVNEAYRAWLAYSFLLVDKLEGVYEPHDGAGFYEVNYGYSAALYVNALDMFGAHSKADLYIDSLLHFQQPDGLYTQNYGLPDHGALLIGIAEHFKLTGDTAWLQRVAPKVISACDWILRQRESAPKTGVVRGLIKFRSYCDYSDPVYGYYGDSYTCAGLTEAAKVLEAIGIQDQARKYAEEAKSYRADILASMDAAAIRQANRTVLPLEPDTHRLLKDSGYTGSDYYSLVASMLLETGIPSADDQRSRWITDFLEQKSGIMVGLCRFQPGGIDHAYSYGYLMTHLRRDNPRKVLLGFYGMLAYGMTRDTYAGVECTNVVTGQNYWTLPHLYSGTQQLRLLRNMILLEVDDTLHIGDAVPREWLEDGKVIVARQAPTSFGDVSFTISSQVKNGRITMQLTPPNRTTPEKIRITLRHPEMKQIHSVTLNGSPLKTFKGETIDLQDIKATVAIEVHYK